MKKYIKTIVKYSDVNEMVGGWMDETHDWNVSYDNNVCNSSSYIISDDITRAVDECLKVDSRLEEWLKRAVVRYYEDRQDEYYRVEMLKYMASEIVDDYGAVDVLFSDGDGGWGKEPVLLFEDAEMLVRFDREQLENAYLREWSAEGAVNLDEISDDELVENWERVQNDNGYDGITVSIDGFDYYGTVWYGWTDTDTEELKRIYAGVVKMLDEEIKNKRRETLKRIGGAKKRDALLGERKELEKSLKATTEALHGWGDIESDAIEAMDDVEFWDV